MGINLSLSRLESLPDVIEDELFLFTVGAIPGVPATDDLSFSIDSITMPGLRTNPIEIKILGHTRYWRGGQTYGDQRLQLTLYENVTASIFNKLSLWHKATVDPETGNSLPGFRTFCNLQIIDTTGVTAIEFTFGKVFIEEIQSSTLNGQGSKPLQINTSLVYDWFETSVYNDGSLTTAFNQLPISGGTIGVGGLVSLGINVNAGGPF